MKFIPFLILIALPTFSFAEGESGGVSDSKADAVTGAHGAFNSTVLRESGGNFLNAADDAVYKYVSQPAKEVARNVGNFFADVIDGSAKKIAISNGDAVSVNANTYLLTLRKEEKENADLNKTSKNLEEQSRVYKRSEGEVERLKGLAEDYKKNAVEFQQNLNTAVKDLAETTQKIDGLSAAQKQQIAGFLDAHKKLGEDTAKSGDPKFLDHMAVSMTQMLSNVDNAIQSGNLGSQKKTFEGRIERMRDYMQKATDNFKVKEQQISEATNNLNSSREQLAKLSTEEQQLRRDQVLSSLNNSVVGLINNAEYSKVRSQLAFAHFDDIAKELKDKGLDSKAVKKAYKDNIGAIVKQYDETPIGLYVSEKIQNAFGNVCEEIANNCPQNADKMMKLINQSRDIKFPNFKSEEATEHSDTTDKAK